jgi:hypothetical protein
MVSHSFCVITGLRVKLFTFDTGLPPFEHKNSCCVVSHSSYTHSYTH